MSLALSPEQEMIRDAAESFLADASASTAVRAAMDSAAGFDPGTWRRIAVDLGWCATAIPQPHGGLGLGPLELALIQEQAGRRLLCSPFFATTCLAATLVQCLGGEAAQAQLLPPLAAGRLAASAALPDGPGDWEDATTLRARPASGGWLLDGRVERLPDVTGDSLLLVFAQAEREGVGLFAVPAASAAIRTTRGWDAGRRFSTADFAATPPLLRVDAPGNEGLVRSAALVRLYLAAEQLGGAQQCLDLTVAHVAARRQFGRALASFQAVKHRCAEMMVRVEALRSAVYGAAAGGGDALDCAMAHAQGSDTFFFCAQEAIQLHGGIGFTWEHDLHLYLKRAQASSHWLGTPPALRARIAGALFERAA